MNYFVQVFEKVKEREFKSIETKNFYTIDEFKCWWKCKYANKSKYTNKEFTYRLYKFEDSGN